jgi:putative ABC transport system substrate-binding protein
MARGYIVPMRMTRRGLSATIALAACTALWPWAAPAADPVRPMRVGVIFGRIPVRDLAGPSPAFPGAQMLREGLRSRGWVEGRNVEIFWRSTEGELQRAGAIADELVHMPVDILAISGNPQITAARDKTRAIPIVMIVSTQPVAAGLVSSLARPGANVTGMYAEPDASLNGKRLALLKQAFPGAARVAFLHDGRVNSMTGGITAETAAAAKALGIELLPFGVDTQQQLRDALDKALALGANALFVDTSLSAASRDQAAFHEFAQRHKLPAMHTYANAVTTGGLMFYGTDSSENYRLAADYIDRILRGANPGELPVQLATKYLLTLNLEAARRIGLTVPRALLGQADQIIQ